MTAEEWYRFDEEAMRDRVQRFAQQPEVHRLLVQQVMRRVLQRLHTVPVEG
jgi:hypothetical protein